MRAVQASRHTTGTNSARPKQGVLARHEYGLLMPTGNLVNPADVGDPCSKAVKGGTWDQDGRKPEEGDEKHQRALFEGGRYGIGDEGRGPPKRSRALNVCGRQGGKRWGGTPTQQNTTTGRSKGPGGNPKHGTPVPHRAVRTRKRKPPPPPQQRA